MSSPTVQRWLHVWSLFSLEEVFFPCLIGKAKFPLSTQLWTLEFLAAKASVPECYSEISYGKGRCGGVLSTSLLPTQVAEQLDIWFSALSDVAASPSTHVPDFGTLWLMLLRRDSTMAICLERSQPLLGYTPHLQSALGQAPALICVQAW